MNLTWDPERGRYRYQSGRIVGLAQVRAALDADAAVLSAYAGTLADQFGSGALSIDEFRDQMRELIKQTHVTATALAAGGRDQVSATEWGNTGAAVKREYQHLDGWVTEIIAGEAPLDGRMRTRAGLYAQAGRETYHRVQSGREQEAGANEERCVLHPAEHCDDCISEAARGWVPIGTLIPIGQRQCGRNCKCTMEFRTNPDADDGTAAAQLQFGSEEERARKLAEIDERIRKAIESGASPGTLAAYRANRTRILQAMISGGPPIAQPPAPPPTPTVDPLLASKLADLERRIAEQISQSGKASPGLLAARTKLLRQIQQGRALPPVAPPRPAKYDLSKPPSTVRELEDRMRDAVGAQVTFKPPTRKWGRVIRDEARRMEVAGRQLMELERMKAKYPNMEPLGTVIVAEHEGGLATLRYSTTNTSQLQLRGTSDPPGTLQKTYQQQRELQGFVHNVGVEHGEWPQAVIRHELAHNLHTRQASVAWAQAKAVSARDHGIDLDQRVDPPPGKTGPLGSLKFDPETRTSVRGRAPRLKRYAYLISEYGSKDSDWEEIAEAANMVSAPWYRPGMLPRPIEMFVERLYDGNRWTGFAQDIGYTTRAAA